MNCKRCSRRFNNRLVLLVTVIYAIVVVSFQINFIQKEGALRPKPITLRHHPFPNRLDRKKLQQVVELEDLAEIWVLSGKDGTPIDLISSKSSDSTTETQTEIEPEAEGEASETETELEANKIDSPLPSLIPSSTPSSTSSSSTPQSQSSTNPPIISTLNPIPTLDLKPPKSTLVCKKGKANCVVKNLYYVDKKFHVYIPGSGQEKEVVVNTGIGYGTPSVILRIHPTDPPTNFGNLPQVKELTSIYSIMWENFMRTIYGGSGAWFTLMEHEIFTPEHRIILHEPVRLQEFIFLLDHVTPFPYQFLEDVGDCVFNFAVIGISRSFRIKEIELEYVQDDDLRKKAFMQFSGAVRAGLINQSQSQSQSQEGSLSTIEPQVHISFINRKSTRLVLNFDELMSEINSLDNVNATRYYFEDIPFKEQVKVVYESDVNIAMHGAAMAHIFFMKPGSTVIELFPYGFQKIVYQNIARMVNVKYVAWRNEKVENTIFNWEYVESHKMTNLTQEEITTMPLDWFNMDSKNYWRQQDTIVDIPNFMYTLNLVLQTKNTPYMMYFPAIKQSPSIQIFQFKLACSISKQLGRVLVIPLLSLNKGMINKKDETFEFLEQYFDRSQQFPCQIFTLSNLNSLFLDLNIESGISLTKTKSFNYQELYENHMQVHIKEFLPLDNVEKSYDSILESLEKLNQTQFLALDNLDLENFGIQSIPTIDTSTLLNIRDYKVTTLKFQLPFHLLKPMELLRKHLEKNYLGVHFYRGEKCSQLPLLENYSCSPSLGLMETKIKELSKYPIIYISSPMNIPEDELKLFMKSIQTQCQQCIVSRLHDIFSPDLQAQFKDIQGLNPIDLEFLDKQVLIEAKSFIGNYYSSFTQLIAETRELSRKQLMFF